MYNISKLDKNLKEPLKILSKRYNFDILESGKVINAIKINENKLSVSENLGEITIKYNTIPAFLRAFGEIVRSEKNDEKIINKDSDVHFTFNGLMVDCSRNGVINISYMKTIIETLAIMGHNVLMMYMEDTYKLESEKYFGYLRGAYSKEELKEIDEYAKMFGIEVIPCIQTLSHLDQFLCWSYGQGQYIDIDNILDVSSNKVKDLLRNIIKELSQIFTTNRIHIGMDEAYNLGRGRYADKNGLKEKSEIMNKHIEFMIQTCNDYNMKPIIWDDMFFSNYSKVKKENFKIPDGVDLMYWDYYNNTQEHYEENFKIRRSITNKNIMFAGGAWIWIGYASHHGKTLASVNASLTACKKNNIKEVLVTAWGDDGAECPTSSLFFGCSLFAEHQYNEVIDMEIFKKNLEFATKMDFECYMKQQEFDIIPDIEDDAAIVTPSKYMLYEDPLCSLFYNHIKPIKQNLKQYYLDLAKYFEEEANLNIDEISKATSKFYAIFGEVLSIKYNLGINIYDAYKENDKNKLKTIIKEQIIPLTKLTEKLKFARMDEWYKTKKSIGFEVLDGRFGVIINRLYTTKLVLEAYIDGKIDKIDELEEVRLDIIKRDENQKNNYIIHYNRCSMSMTANKIVW